MAYILFLGELTL